MVSVPDAAELIKSGELVAFPTETVYGLGANALDEHAVMKIFAKKGRPIDNPVIVHVASVDDLQNVVHSIPKVAKRLIEVFWPGPLTLIFRKKKTLPNCVTAGLDTVAVRMPEHPVALDLIRNAGVPIAAPSANKSGKPSPTSASHVQEDFSELAIIDGGDCHHGVESTVVALDGTPRVLRIGAITVEELQDIIPEIRVADQHPSTPESPGLKHKHYTPSRPLVLFQLENIEEMKQYVKNRDVVVLCKNHHSSEFDCEIVSLGHSDEDMAHHLFRALRTHKKGAELVVLGTVKRGHGRAVMDRLERAASKII